MVLADNIVMEINVAAKEHGLPFDVIYGIVCQESSGKPNAVRYEPGFLKRYLLKIPGLGTTERKARATSYGLMQILGQTARENGFGGDFSVLFDPRVNLYWGCLYLKRLKKRYYEQHGWPGVISAYNAGSPRKKGGVYGNQHYVDKVWLYRREAKWPV